MVAELEPPVFYIGLTSNLLRRFEGGPADPKYCIEEREPMIGHHRKYHTMFVMTATDAVHARWIERFLIKHFDQNPLLHNRSKGGERNSYHLRAESVWVYVCMGLAPKGSIH